MTLCYVLIYHKGMSLTRIEGCDHDNVLNKLQVKIWALYILVK